MIKKIYAILCALSLITTLPAFGMENNAYPMEQNQLASDFQIYQLLSTTQDNPDFCLPQELIQAITIKAHEMTCMEKNIYPCDFCREKKSLLNYKKIKRDGIACLHILCEECQGAINGCLNKGWQKPADDKVWWNCDYCSYFCNLEKKQCWQISEKEEYSLTGATRLRATHFNEEYPNRTLPGITDTTLFHPNPEHTLPWFHIASFSIATVVCYITYKTLNYV